MIFYFVALLKKWCDWQVQQFLNVCNEIKFPVALEKTFWGSTLMTFLGLLLDSDNQVVCIPQNKIDKARKLIVDMLSKKHYKVRVDEVQKLCRLLNFLYHCVILGRAFLTWMYSLTASNMKPHDVKTPEDIRLDLKTWLAFLKHLGVFCRPFMDFKEILAIQINMFSDASRNFEKGFGSICGTSWTFGVWDKVFMEQNEPSIEFLELFGVTLSVLNWIYRFKNKRIRLYCDSMNVVQTINNSSSQCRNCMNLIRIITLKSMVNNARVFTKHISSKNNGPTEALSRLEFDRFRRIAPEMDEYLEQIPEETKNLDLLIQVYKLYKLLYNCCLFSSSLCSAKKKS